MSRLSHLKNRTWCLHQALNPRFVRIVQMHHANLPLPLGVQVAKIGDEHHPCLRLKRWGRWADVFGVPLHTPSR